MRMRNITLDHLDCEISRDQPCEWGIEWDTYAPGLLCVWLSNEAICIRRRFRPKLLTHSNDTELEFQFGRAYPAVK
jgi:hypothetical protein